MRRASFYCRKQGRIYSKRALFRKKCGDPRAPNTIIGLLLPPTVPSITSLSDCLHTHTKLSFHWQSIKFDSVSTASVLKCKAAKAYCFYFYNCCLAVWIFYYFNDFRAISVCWHVAEIFFWSSSGAPFLWGPLFGRICWTCLNPPLLRITA